MACNPWTDDEITFLKANIENLSYREIGYGINRSERAISCKSFKLGLANHHSSLKDLKERKCRSCKAVKQVSQFPIANDRISGRHCICKKCKSNNKNLTSQQLRIKILNHYGNKCTCCQVSNLKFLTIDHVLGAAHEVYPKTKKGTRADGVTLYKWIIQNNYPDNITILCYNCNCGRAQNDGICPHLEERSILDKDCIEVWQHQDTSCLSLQ